jgi:hypothetical protein
MVRGPTSVMNSSEPTTKRSSASMCQTKRKGWRRSIKGASWRAAVSWRAAGAETASSAIGASIAAVGAGAAAGSSAAPGETEIGSAAGSIGGAATMAGAMAAENAGSTVCRSVAVVSATDWAGGVPAGGGAKVRRSTRPLSLPRRSTVTLVVAPPILAFVCTLPVSGAAKPARLKADSVVAPASRAHVAALAWTSVPSAPKAAMASLPSANSRRTRSPSVNVGPAASPATMSTPARPSSRTTREQTQVSARPKPAPNPRSRSSRSCARDGSVAPRRMT